MNTLTKDQIEAMDDMAVYSDRVTESDLDRCIAAKAVCLDGCKGACDQGRAPCEFAPREAASACSEFLEEHHGRERMGAFKGWERWATRNPATAVMVFGVTVLLGVPLALHFLLNFADAIKVAMR